MKFIAVLISSLLLCAAAARIKIENFGPDNKPVYSTESVPADKSASSFKDAAIAFAKTKFGLDDSQFLVSSFYRSNSGITNVYLKQLKDGMEVYNGCINVSIHEDKNEIIAYGSSFAKAAAESPAGNPVVPLEAVKALSKHLKLSDAFNPIEEIVDGLLPGNKKYKFSGVPNTVDKVETEKGYMIDGKKLVSVWRVNMKLDGNWFDSHVAIDGSKVVALNDWTADASYNVIKLGDSDPVTTPRAVVTDPHKPSASPNGWHDDGAQYTNTRGNNVLAHENWDGDSSFSGSIMPDGGTGLNFDFPLDLSKDPKNTNVPNDPDGNIKAAVTNLFYMNNALHDLFYFYGFDEAAGNFQKNNWGKGGKDNDFVIAQAQDGSGENNAQFSTPPDGQNGVMKMFLCTVTNPHRDGDLDNDIIAHEYGHGVSNRLTGGPANVNCLSTTESGGMGEGWSDFFAYVIQMKESDTRSKNVVVGEYAFGSGIRNYPYSTDKAINPTTYAKLRDWKEVHQIGEVWANMLYEVYWNVREATNKFNPDWYSADLTAGNTLMLKLVVTGFTLQVCNPTFQSARDAIIKAEKVLTGEKYKCAIWKAFAKRGLGPKAINLLGLIIIEDYNPPSGC